MRSFLLATLLALLIVQPDVVRLTSATPPVPPLNSPFVGVVVLNVTIDSNGNVQNASDVAGVPPFLEASRNAIRYWKFATNDSASPQSVNVTFLYRSRQIFSSGSGIQLPGFPIAPNRPASPILVYDAAYPVDSVAEGVVILDLKISANGVIEQINTVRDIPSLTAAARRAVAAWKFSPAVSNGRPVEGTTIVAISYLRPVS